MIRMTGPALALKQFNTDPNTGQVQIVGRAPGFFGWLLSVMGVDAQTELHVNAHEVRLRSASLFGEISTACPTTQIATVSAGYAKPVQFLIAAVASAFTIIGPIIFLVLYFLEKRIVVMVESTGGNVLTIAFKRSVIEGVEVDVDNARQVMQFVNQHVANANRKALPAG